MWSRPVNDNFGEDYFDENGKKSTEKSNYLDNIDLFMLSVPLSFDGVEVTPWAMYGMRGKTPCAASKKSMTMNPGKPAMATWA